MPACSSIYSTVGWELLYKSSQKDISQKTDLIILLVHWVLIMEKDFKCVGLGTEKTLTDTDRESASDLLPDGWSQNEVYFIRYMKNNVLYVLTGAKANFCSKFILNFLHVLAEVASNIVINIEGTVKEQLGSIHMLFANYPELIRRIKKELIDPPAEINQTPFSHSDHSVLRIGNPRRTVNRDIGVGNILLFEEPDNDLFILTKECV